MSFDKVLIANRGEIAVRVIRTLRRMGLRSVAVFSEADTHAQHVRLADEAVAIGAAPVADSYLRADRLIAAAVATGAGGIHPGYGFLAENADFAEACAAAGVRFIGPTPAQIRRFGLKHLAREIATREGVPLLPGTGLLATVDEALSAAERIGYPVMLKSTAGGGGIGLRVCEDAAALAQAFPVVQRLSQKNFDDGGAFLEKYLARARHVEVQIFGDGQGRVMALGERDCSTQRRNQKVIEETPAPGLSTDVRARLFAAAEALGRAVQYASAGTVEFVLDARTQDFYFLEVNTRLQVEHGVTEEVSGLDLVQWMVQQAAGTFRWPAEPPVARGAAIQVRLYAEDPSKDFRPSTGTISALTIPPDVRWDGWIEPGTEISPHYDPLLGKLVVHGPDRAAALEKLSQALSTTQIHGLETNLAYLRDVIAAPAFVAGQVHTRLLDGVSHQPRTIDVIDGGMQSTVQDWPGRTGLWAVGVPPSGPMDDRAFRLANRLVGNPASAPALELTLTGPTLRFNTEAVIALTGAVMATRLDGQPVPYGRPVVVPAGSTLRLGAIAGAGARAYLAVRGGLDVPAYLGSHATFMLGGFGGHGGRALRAGDVLRLGGHTPVSAPVVPLQDVLPTYDSTWEIAVLYGPHGAPDYFHPEDIQTFFATAWEVHYNSDRTGVRLVGPRPRWARPDGGEAGLHPSNIHDNAYAIGTVDFTGDMPILLGPDGPSLGGFVCPATIVRADRWKMGQLKAGDRVRFRRVSEAEAHELDRAAETSLESLRLFPVAAIAAPAADAILDEISERPDRCRVLYRRDGDDHMMVEYGPPVLDLALRFRVHALMQAIQRRALPGVIDLTPGIRSLQVHHDPRVLSTSALLQALRTLEAQLPDVDDLQVPTRIVHLPLAWEDPATLQAIERYMRVVRKDAPWCPSNIEFIRRINGLPTVDDVRRLVYDASYLVLGLGDVYLGAPVATPLDPRHRLVTTKYNPARTWTPENAVGIGGAYMCIYGMEGPGGYQFVGRTVQVWNTHRQVAPFRDGKPWLLRFFDQIRFYPVEPDELLRLRAGFLHGRVPLQIDEEVFDFRRYRQFLQTNQVSIEAFRSQQRQAFAEERERWKAAGQDLPPAASHDLQDQPRPEPIPDGCFGVTSPMAGSLWRQLCAPGDRVQEGAPLAIVEAMKTEIPVPAPASGVVRSWRVTEGSQVRPGQILAVCSES